MIADCKNNLNSFFTFSFRSEVLSQLKDKDICTLCLFFSEEIFDDDSIIARISTFATDYHYTSDIENGVVNHIIIIFPETEAYKKFSNSGHFKKDFEKHRFLYLLEDEEPLYIHYSDNGVWSTTDAKISDDNNLEKLIEEIKINGIYDIFEEGNGILESGPAHHYVLQNEYHADKFIRTANILTKSSYIDFIAVFLLKFVSGNNKQVYIDTSGIISVVYSISKLKNIFVRGFHLNITSFNSYTGINSMIIDSDTKVLISASTSGKLSKRLIEMGISKENINILFYLNKVDSEVNVVCNLDKFKQLTNSDKYTPFKIETELDCSFCKDFSYPIKIVGEQFLPEELKVDTFTFDLSDRPIWLTKFIRSYFTKKGIITCFLRQKDAETKRDIYIHFDKIIPLYDEFSNNRLDKYCSTKLPNKIDVLIYYEDAGSVLLKELILNKYISKEGVDEIEDSQLNQKKAVLKNKNVLIISSTITNGRRLVETSLKLRDAECQGICYFVAISRSPDELTLETTQKYIGFDNKYGRDINPLIIVDSIFIADSRVTSTFSETDISPWEVERDFLRKTMENNNFETRISDLESKDGLVDNLFWGNCENESLKLRPNFAFYSGIENLNSKTKDTSQAEVFFLINTVLHNLRRNTNKKIVQSAFHRNVILPETFICYNDGVIQASILRSAIPIELNYCSLGNNTRIGTEMINVVKYIFNNFDNDAGEASIEFLIAICTRRLQLIKKELTIVISNFYVKVEASNVGNKEVILTLCRYIQNNICNESK